MNKNLDNRPHKRYNILTGEWILVSPHRTKRPWQGKNEDLSIEKRPTYDPACYLCPGNTRNSGEKNPDYSEPYSFINDYSALLPTREHNTFEDHLLKAESEEGICKVICFSPDHSLTLPVMKTENITKVIDLWVKEYHNLGKEEFINYVQIFENKGEMMGCSNPHPHGQIWSQHSIPTEVLKKTHHFKKYWDQHQRSLLSDYLEQELELGERIIEETEHFVVLVPYWAVWPYETMIIPKQHYQHIGQLTSEERKDFALAIKKITTRYDNLFQISFPYSSGIHQIPTDGKDYPEWHFHMSFYPPLLRSATVKKFMVGYEMFAGPQRDITAEQASATLRELPEKHFTERG